MNLGESGVRRRSIILTVLFAWPSHLASQPAATPTVDYSRQVHAVFCAIPAVRFVLGRLAVENRSVEVEHHTEHAGPKIPGIGIGIRESHGLHGHAPGARTDTDQARTGNAQQGRTDKCHL